MSGVNLAPDHAVELTELLQFLTARPTSDRDHLDTSPHRYIGHPAYNIDRPKTDLARFTFLLGGDTDGELFQPPAST